MNLNGDENVFQTETKKPNKMKNYILIGIVVIFCIILILCYQLMATQETPITAQVNGSQKNDILAYMSEDSDGVIYFNIKKVAPYFGYLAYNGDSVNKSESTYQCYVTCDDETVDLSLHSKYVYKTLKNSASNQYDYAKLNNVVKSIDGELYMSQDGIAKVFNTTYYYNSSKKIHVFETMENKYTRLNTAIMSYTSLNLTGLDSQYINKKALLDNYAVVVDGQTKKYGVVNIAQETNPSIVIEAKYDLIEYIPALTEFIVTSDSKKGVLKKDGSTLFDLSYEDIDLIDQSTLMFCVKKDGKYGIAKDRYETVLDIEYEQIGIDSSKFLENNVKNQYFLVDNLIPIKRENKWRLLNKSGDKIVDCEYDEFGCVQATSQYQSNLLYIPSYNILVARKDKKYALLDSSGNVIIPDILDSCYIYTKDGKSSYIMYVNDKEYNIEDYISAKTQLKKVNETIDDTTDSQVLDLSDDFDSVLDTVSDNSSDNSSDNNNDDNYNYDDNDSNNDQNNYDSDDNYDSNDDNNDNWE